MVVCTGKKRGEIVLKETKGLRCVARLNKDLSGDIVIQGMDELGYWYDKFSETLTTKEIKNVRMGLNVYNKPKHK